MENHLGLSELVTEDQLPQAQRRQAVSVKRQLPLRVRRSHDLTLAHDPPDEPLHGLGDEAALVQRPGPQGRAARGTGVALRALLPYRCGFLYTMSVLAAAVLAPSPD